MKVVELIVQWIDNSPLSGPMIVRAVTFVKGSVRQHASPMGHPYCRALRKLAS